MSPISATVLNSSTLDFFLFFFFFCRISLRDASAEVKPSPKNTSEEAQALLHSKQAEILEEMD